MQSTRRPVGGQGKRGGWAWLGVSLLLAACGGDAARGVDEKCFEEGRCACRDNADCSDGVCVDGQCRAVIDTSVDTVQDSAPPPDTIAPEEVVITPGGFLWPCTADDECDSGKCIATSSVESVCTRRCIESCPNDWNCRGVANGAGLDFYCVPERDRLCEPCLVDEACPGEGNACVPLASGGSACGRACGDGLGTCPDGFGCQVTVNATGEATEQCVPLSGVCVCRTETEGSEVPCNNENAFGICFGVSVCQADGAVGECSAREPLAELCNGQDDDCNGFTDDGIAVSTCEIENDAGRCVGDRQCLPGAGEVCTAATPRAEVCDNLDDDCDGLTDEDFRVASGQVATLEHCGACNTSCVGRYANAATTRCEVPAEGAPRCVIEACEAGFVLAGEACVRPPDGLCQPCTSDAVCGGPNDRCLTLDATDERRFCGRDCAPGNIYGGPCPDGYTCRETGAGAQCEPSSGACDCSAQNDGQTRPCSNQNAAGACFGTSRCDADGGGWSSCTARTPTAEVCNGLDDDCDGVSDDGLGGTACLKTNAFGSCPGVQTCDGAQGSLVCVGPLATAELCNGIDDDCDGETDEDFAFNIRDAAGAVVALKYAKSDAHCGGCNLACTATAPATAVSCDGSGAQPACRVEACARGYWLDDAHVCLPVPTGNVCQQCETDADCQGPDDRCLTGPAGRFCGRDCSLGSIYDGIDGACSATSGARGCCPSGFRCVDTQCLPESGDCSCRTTGKLRACEVSNAAGKCSGVESCTATGSAAGWGTCSAATPEVEICNGIDDDCDGLVDSQDNDVIQSAPDGYPSCERVSGACTGRLVCGGDAGWLCTARVPESEICNRSDDDCDGATDEGFVDASGAYSLVSHCGQCGLDCGAAIANLAPGASAACELVDGALTCVPVACAAGFVPFPSGAPRVCLPLAAASCRPCGVDAECGLGGDKCVPVGSDDGKFCAQPCGVGSAYAGCTGVIGEQGCCADGYACEDVSGQSLCMPVTGSCQCSEERLGAPRGCTKAGNGGQTTCFGVESCEATQSGYGWSPCDLAANVEVCDRLDNDCDGLTDEGFKSQGLYILDSHCGACGRNCIAAYAGSGLHATGECDRDPDDPRCTIGVCLASTEPVGVACRVDADCAGQIAGSVCDPALHMCRKGCAGDGDCGAGATCDDGVCATTCLTSPQCTAAFGPQSSCVGDKCVGTFDWADLDQVDGNGCECAAARGGGSDRPDVLGSVAAPGANYVDSDCDGVDGDVASAIFVREGEVAGDGSLAAPFGTIGEAVAALDVTSPAATAATPILVAGGVFEEPVVVVNGMVMHGGYSEDFAARDIVLYPTLIVADESQLATGANGTVTATGIDQPTELVGFTIVGWDATSQGTSTYALYVHDSTSALVVANCVIVGGRAGAGVAGGNGTPGDGGGDGGNGANSRECATNDCRDGENQAGGAAGTNGTCASAAGCIGMESEAESPQTKANPASGCTYPTGGTVGTYQGNPVEACKYDFTPGGNQVGGDGTDGGDGGNGGGGAGCNDSDGAIVDGRWQGGIGTGGAGGGAGAGGNGGAAGGWATNQKDSTCTVPTLGANFGDLGGSGGGGGAGGCGGGPGAAGGSGGASFAVFVAPRGSSHPRLEFNTIARGRAGAGGAGGNGGTGGRGGNGGRGGVAGWPAWGAGIGGSGGRGGDGGDAGGGGGGCGGPSYGIAGPGIAAATYGAGNQFAQGDGVSTSGRGGGGGLSAGAGAGGPGIDGESKNVKAF